MKRIFSWLFLVLFLKRWFKKAGNSPHNVNNDPRKKTLPTALQEKRKRIFFTLLKIMEQKKMNPLQRERKIRGFNKHYTQRTFFVGLVDFRDKISNEETKLHVK